MPKIKILVDTYAKQSTAQAHTLPPDKIHLLTAGSILEANAVTAKGDNHSTVAFKDKLAGYQSWILYNSHFQVDGKPVTGQRLLLAVPYFSQRDNQQDWQRTCNTSSCAMAAEFLKKGCCHGSDDWYYANCVKPIGDTTDHAVQTRALEKLGIKSRFRYDLDYADIDRELDAGRPAVLGVLHKGTVSAPTGSGHMIVVIGRYDEGGERGYFVNDPWGEGFSYSNHNGRQVKYPRSSLDGRWLVDGPRTGWGRLFA